MSTAKRLVLSFRRGKQQHPSIPTTSSTRLVSGSTSPGHEIDEIAVLPASSHPLIYGGGQYGKMGGTKTCDIIFFLHKCIQNASFIKSSTFFFLIYQTDLYFFKFFLLWIWIQLPRNSSFKNYSSIELCNNILNINMMTSN